MAIDLTGIQNVGEFYSHHYLDALLESDLKGLLARWRTEDETTPDRRLNRCATDFFAAKSRALRQKREFRRWTISHEIHRSLMNALGYDCQPQVRYLPDGSAMPLLGEVVREGRPYLWLVETAFVLDDNSPLESRLLREQLAQAAGSEEAADELSLPDLPWEELIGELLRLEAPPRWIILLAGRYIYLVERGKWGQGQYLLFDLDEIFGRRETSTLRATAAFLTRESLCPSEGAPLHDTLDENSHKHAYAVSSDLKYGVRQAVELLANEYVWYLRNVSKQALFQDEKLAEKLTSEALIYLYRLLFLFYAEARGGELDLLPMKSDAYRTGYSLEALRDLEQIPLTTPQAQSGYFFHESLERLFKLMNEGFAPQQRVALDAAHAALPADLDDYGFRIQGLHSPLFDRKATPLLSSVKFRNTVLQGIVQSLSLSKESKGRKSQRGRISYAQLGINQLGAVYEGLLAYTGFFAREDLYEVKPADAKEGDEGVQTYFVPESQLPRYTAQEFVYAEGADGVKVRKKYGRGSFIFHLAGRNREKSASYYTPEVLTQCVVKYSLKELLQGVSADEILRLTICEPAMGSGAFINEALNQLADAYLQRKQQELDQRLPPDDYREERQRVKAYLAAHNVYGVDLNPTAVELANVSIWLNTIYRGAAAPWYTARLAVGNSLIGARRQVYSAEEVKSGDYANKAPMAVALGTPRPAGSVYHFLLPDKGLAAFDSDAVIKELAPDAVAQIKAWRKQFTTKISPAELKNLQALSERIDQLWQRHVSDRQTLLARTRQPIPVWGQSPIANLQSCSIQEKEGELAKLHHPTSAFRRLKLAMDYWCSLWFWPIQEAEKLPSRNQFLNDLDELLRSEESGFVGIAEQLPLYGELPAESSKPKQSSFADVKASNVDELARSNPRLGLVNQVAATQRFHHWELAFADVFAERGGFDLVVGNPPWVKLNWEEKGVLSESEPLLIIRKNSSSDVTQQRNKILDRPERIRDYLNEFVDIYGNLEFLDALQNYPLLKGMQTNLFKCFITRSWEVGSRKGIAGLLHPEGVFDDSKGGKLREALYPRIKHCYRFTNVLKLFSDILHWVDFCVCIYQASAKSEIQFSFMGNVFHPKTLYESEEHTGEGNIPGIKDENENWQMLGHKERFLRIDRSRLRNFANLYDSEGTPPLQARLPVIHSEQLVTALAKFVNQPQRLADLQEYIGAFEFWHERNRQVDGTIKHEVRYPNSVQEWIVAGPHYYVATPFAKNPNEECRNPLDYGDIDLTSIPDDYLPRTTYIPACDDEEYRKRIPRWQGEPIYNRYHHLNRARVSPPMERTLINAILPPLTTQIDGSYTIVFDSNKQLVQFSGLCSSIPYDFFVKVSGKDHLRWDLISLFPIVEDSQWLKSICVRALRLNCLTIHYENLWNELYSVEINSDSWTSQDPRLKPWSDLTPQWQRHVALRTPFERRQALVEIDVLASMALGLTLDELLTIYRVQFPVLQKNERRLRFDQRGMEVPMKTLGGELVPDENHETLAEMAPPFTPVDREADYRVAWAEFARRLGEG